MLKLKDWIAGHLGLSKPSSGPDDTDSLNLAVAALLVEVLRADYEATAEERGQVVDSLRAVLDLGEAEGARLLERAERRIDDSHDLYQFTSRINQSCSSAEKERLVEQLWRVARADAIIHKYEEHLIRRIADLLHVSHSAFIAGKLRSGR
jgi:uncharacterized tellurite resistance protein B-like protein